MRSLREKLLPSYALLLLGILGGVLVVGSMGSREHLSRAVTNLVDNALRHTPPGGRVDVKARVIDHAVEFTVADTGEGIPSEFLPHLFERFVQVPGTSSRVAGLLDQRMPGMDGLNVLRRIRERAPQAEVIMVTAFATVEPAVEAMKAGALDFLRKPFTPDVLRHTVAAGLERGRARGVRQPPHVPSLLVSFQSASRTARAVHRGLHPARAGFGPRGHGEGHPAGRQDLGGSILERLDDRHVAAAGDASRED